MHMRSIFSAALLAAAGGIASQASAHPEYRVTIVGPADSFAMAINNAGVVVGNFQYKGETRAFLNRGKGLVDVAGAASYAMAINNKGQVLGNWGTPAGQGKGFIYYRGARRTLVGPVGFSMRFTDINDHGYITAAGYKIDSFEGSRGFLRAPSGAYHDIGTLPFDNPLTEPHALNNSNVITGASGPLTFPDQPLRAIVWAKGVMRDIGDFGLDPNEGIDINNAGQITGFMSVNGIIHDRVAILYSKGRLINIDGRPDTTISRFSEGAGINNHGHVVGYADHLGGFVYRGKKMQSLDSLVDPKLKWKISFPRAINDNGQIAATAYRNNVQYAVRLDLLRPHLLRAPDVEDDALALTAPGKAKAADAEAQEDAAAEAREIAQPLQQ